MNGLLQTGIGGGQLAGQGQVPGSQSIGPYATAGDQANAASPPPGTLLRALSHVDVLNKRLSEVSNRIEEIATAIGGPRPCDPTGGQKASGAPSAAMLVLNDRLDESDARVNAIEESVAAIRRTLGA